ncbi:uncharacterized protein LOC119732219 [Patiria miniata]|uniref:Uncharacterized protein n=1 Tax=Patiria miniata TaxID=46514 RepID=A0A914ADL7_PATMI|nr:uncharacterized protein LOC119732219 [Patiria miniata]
MFKLLVTVFLLSLAVTPSVSWDSRCPPITDFMRLSISSLWREEVEQGGAFWACAACHRMVCTLEQIKTAYYEEGYGTETLSWYNPDPNTLGMSGLGLADVNACSVLTSGPCLFEVDGVRAVRVFPGTQSNHGHALCCQRPDDESDMRSYRFE